MTKLMLMDAKHTTETRVVILDDDIIEDFDFVTSSKEQIKGNIYLAKITRVEPSLQAAFVEYGGNKQGFLPFSEIHPDYYQIPVADRQKLIEEELAEAQREEEEEEAEIEGRDNGKRGGARRGRSRRRGRRRDREENTQGEGEAVYVEGAESEEELGAGASEASASSDISAVDASKDASDRTHENESEADSVKPLRAQAVVVASEPMVFAENGEAASDEDGENFVPQSAYSEDASSEAEEGEDELDEVETISASESEDRPRRRGSSFKRYRIQEVIKRNQIVLVQVIKEERGNKGCSLTTYLSLAGRYCVLMPNSPKAGGVSRKISNGEQRRKLKEMLGELRDKRGFAAIVRTAGLDRTKTEIKRDYEYLVKLWSQIREDTLASTAPSLIYEESDIIKRCLRDLYTNDIEEILVQGDEAYKDSKAFMKLIMPSHAPRVKEYKDELPIFARYGVEEQLASMYEPTVKMPSGGYVVIQATEALTSIDVNSGRSTSERNVEETAIKTNLEAAREVARQMRLRDIAGLVVIDFIDMYYGKNRRTLERAMKDYLRHDRAKIQVSRISPFGLMELSRQRLRPSISESSTTVCMHCLGVGFVKSMETVAIQIIRLLEREAVSGGYVELRVQATPDVVLHLLNEKRGLIQEIESQNDVTIIITIGADISAGHFRLYKVGEDGKESLHQELESDRRKRKNRGRRGGRGRRRREEGAEGEMDTRGGSYESDDADEEDLDDTFDAEEEVQNAQPVNESSGNAHHGERPRRRRDKRRRSRGERGAPDSATSTDFAAKDETSADATTIHENAQGASDNMAVASTEKPQGRRRRRARTKPPFGNASESETAAPETSSSASATVHTNTHVVEPVRAPESSQGTSQTEETQGNTPKRKGWWNRMVQSEQSNA